MDTHYFAKESQTVISSCLVPLNPIRGRDQGLQLFPMTQEFPVGLITEHYCRYPTAGARVYKDKRKLLYMRLPIWLPVSLDQPKPHEIPQHFTSRQQIYEVANLVALWPLRKEAPAGPYKHGRRLWYLKKEVQLQNLETVICITGPADIVKSMCMRYKLKSKQDYPPNLNMPTAGAHVYKDQRYVIIY